jgi:cardiolipin hydrolase
MILQVIVCCTLILFSVKQVCTTIPDAKRDKAYPTLTALFSPVDRPTDKLVELINGAKKSITAAIYMLTDKKIADALIKAKNERLVTIRIALDPISAGKFGKADYLAENNIPIFLYQPEAIHPWFTPILHHKFAIFDDWTLWTGSFNWTVSANFSNAENVLISTDPTTCKAYKAYFETLIKSKCLKYSVPKKQLPCDDSLRTALINILSTDAPDDILFEQAHLILQQHNTGGSAISAK